MAPTPTIAACPASSRGTDCTVPTVPGFVTVIVVPSKSCGDSLPSRTLRSCPSYACQNPAKRRALGPGRRGWLLGLVGFLLRRRLLTARPVVLEELLPRLPHRGRVLGVAAVHLLDQPLVGPEVVALHRTSIVVPIPIRSM